MLEEIRELATLQMLIRGNPDMHKLVFLIDSRLSVEIHTGEIWYKETEVLFAYKKVVRAHSVVSAWKMGRISAL